MAASNPFRVDDSVKTTDNTKLGGVVQYIACNAATNSGGKTCDKKTCLHFIKDFVWVKWPDGKLCSYNHTELSFDKVIAPEPIKQLETGGLSDKEKVKYKETARVLEEEATKASFNWLEYNGIVQTRYTRDGRPYLVDVSGGADTLDIPPIEEKELDFDVYNGKKRGSIKKG